MGSSVVVQELNWVIVTRAGDRVNTYFLEVLTNASHQSFPNIIPGHLLYGLGGYQLNCSNLCVFLSLSEGTSAMYLLSNSCNCVEGFEVLS